MRILLVEDDAMIGKAVLEVLRSEHYAVDWVRDGSAAASALVAERYDLVLLDLGLPKADGLTVLRGLRERRDTVPVLIVAHQPTWGLDVGAVADVHRRLLDACSAGAGLLLISEDLDEILALADRIAVMTRGRLTAARPRDEWNAATLGLAMGGAVGGGREARDAA